jgi:hypothetical protein
MTAEQLRAQTSRTDPAIFRSLEEMRAAGLDPMDERQLRRYLKNRLGGGVSRRRNSP